MKDPLTPSHPKKGILSSGPLEILMFLYDKSIKWGMPFITFPTRVTATLSGAFVQVSIAPSSGDSAQLYLRFHSHPPDQKKVFFYLLFFLPLVNKQQKHWGPSFPRRGTGQKCLKNQKNHKSSFFQEWQIHAKNTLGLWGSFAVLLASHTSTPLWKRECFASCCLG